MKMKRKKTGRSWRGFGAMIGGSLLLLGVVGMLACGDYSSLSGGGFGATQGGVQDLGLAREYVKNGNVPPAAAFPVEGMFSEHDLPLAGAPCQTLLCLRTAMGLSATAKGDPAAFLQVGMSSTVDPATWQRPPQDLIFTVDVSCSMGWSYGDGEETPSPGELSRLLMKRLVDGLGADDRVAIVTYGSRSRTALSPVAADSPTVLREIDALESGGATNMEAGLELALALARNNKSGREQRILLFTDMRPNVGITGSGEFEKLVSKGASEKVGTTIFGLGLGLGAETFEAMSHLRGGNAFSLFDREDVPKLMEESWPFMLTPIAYDLQLEVKAPEGFAVTEAYGFPAAAEQDPAKAAPRPQMSAASVFLSRKRGAMLVEFQTSPVGSGVSIDNLELTGQLRYETPEGVRVEEPLHASVSADAPRDVNGDFFEQPSVGKTVALAQLTEGMAGAAELYTPEPEAAIVTLQAALARYSAAIALYDDTSLEAEVAFATDLLTLMEAGAPQTDLYGR